MYYLSYNLGYKLINLSFGADKCLQNTHYVIMFTELHPGEIWFIISYLPHTDSMSSQSYKIIIIHFIYSKNKDKKCYTWLKNQ